MAWIIIEPWRMVASDADILTRSYNVDLSSRAFGPILSQQNGDRVVGLTALVMFMNAYSVAYIGLYTAGLQHDGEHKLWVLYRLLLLITNHISEEY